MRSRRSPHECACSTLRAEVPGAVRRREVDRGEQRERDGRARERHQRAPARAGIGDHQRGGDPEAGAHEHHRADARPDAGGSLDRSEHGTRPRERRCRATSPHARMERRRDGREHHHGEPRLELVADPVEARAAGGIRPEQRAHQQLRPREGVDREDRHGGASGREEGPRPRQQPIAQHPERQAAAGDHRVLGGGAGGERGGDERDDGRPQHSERSRPQRLAAPARAREHEQQRPRAEQHAERGQTALRDRAQPRHQAAQAARVERAVADDGVAGDRRRIPVRSEPREDCGRDVHRRDEPALARRRRAELCSPARRRAGCADPLERARRLVGDPREHEQQLSPRARAKQRRQVARALRAAGQIGDDEALAAAQRLHPREQRRRRSRARTRRCAPRDRRRALRPRCRCPRPPRRRRRPPRSRAAPGSSCAGAACARRTAPAQPLTRAPSPSGTSATAGGWGEGYSDAATRAPCVASSRNCPRE